METLAVVTLAVEMETLAVVTLGVVTLDDGMNEAKTELLFCFYFLILCF